jgi:hypothetical protein
VDDGTTLYYTLNNASGSTSANFSTAVNGSVIINNNQNNFILTHSSAISANSNFQMDIRTGNSTGPIVFSNTYNIYDDKEIVLVGNTVSSNGTISVPAGAQAGDFLLVSGISVEMVNGIGAGDAQYKILTDPVESTITNGNDGAMVACVFRNVDPDTPVEYRGDGRADNSRNPPLVVSSTANAIILCHSSQDYGVSSRGSITSAPSGYTFLGGVTSAATTGVYAGSTGIAYLKAVTPGVYDPGFFGGSDGDATPSNQTLVLKKLTS